MYGDRVASTICQRMMVRALWFGPTGDRGALAGPLLCREICVAAVSQTIVPTGVRVNSSSHPSCPHPSAAPPRAVNGMRSSAYQVHLLY